MKRFLFTLTLLLVLFISSVEAHPSWGIAVNDRGEIFFADVMHNGTGTLWKIDRQGTVHKVITDFHAHDLQFDPQGNLWIAENRWIQGVVEGEGEHTILRISPSGKIDTLFFTDDRDQFFGGTFALAPNEGIFFTLNNRIYHKSIHGPTTLYLDHTFQRIVTLFSDEDHNLWITDKGHKNGTLYKFNEARGLQEYATDLLPLNPENPVFDEPRHQLLYGIAKDRKGFVYVAENSGRHLLRILPNGEKSNFYTSDPPWHPIGVTFYADTAFIMETGFDHTNIGPRILRMDPEGNIHELFNYETIEGKSPLPGVPGPAGKPGGWILMILLPAAFVITYTLILSKKQQNV